LKRIGLGSLFGNNNDKKSLAVGLNGLSQWTGREKLPVVLLMELDV
jgi:hypothetical protein